jgi:hypothetical protein
VGVAWRGRSTIGARDPHDRLPTGAEAQLGGGEEPVDDQDIAAHAGGRQVLVTPMAGSDISEPRRTLNPLFVEALMGWPTGWTGLASVATAWSLWLRRMRCELWRLNCWPMDEAAV